MSENMDRDMCVCLAKIAEEAESYEDAAHYMKHAVETDAELNCLERILLETAYKHIVGARRATLQKIYEIEEVAKDMSNHSAADFIHQHKLPIVSELRAKCKEALAILDHCLERAAHVSSDPGEAKVYYLQLISDFYLYLAEFTTGTEKKECTEASEVT